MNKNFLKIIKNSFSEYIKVGSSRSNLKLKVLHGNIAKDLFNELGKNYTIKSLGFFDNKETIVEGKYYSKKVDITVFLKEKVKAGIAIKFVMRNYFQNSNNYFESMLGETVNIRANNIPYFQIFIIFDKLPYYKKTGDFKKYELISLENLKKYINLGKQNINTNLHSPNKILLVILNLTDKDYYFMDENEYFKYYNSIIDKQNLITYSNDLKNDFKNTNIIFNDYEKFIREVSTIIKNKK